MRANVETEEKQVASFGDWKKYENTDNQPSFYGAHHHKIKYINSQSEQNISIIFKFGRPSLHFTTEPLSISQLKPLCDKFTRPGNNNTDEQYLRQPWLLTSITDNLLRTVNFETDKVSELRQLGYTLNALADYTHLPKTMQEDIFAALTEHTARQTKHMDELSNKLLHGTADIIKELQRHIFLYNIHEEFGVILRWIDYLVIHNRVNEALLWCDIIPVDSGQAYLDHQKLALHLLADNPDIKHVVLYLNEKQTELSRKEAKFHFTYNIAKFTKDGHDQSAVADRLNKLSTQTCSYTNILSEHSLLIQQARIIQSLQNELAQLKTNNNSNQQSGSLLGMMGIFGTSDSESEFTQDQKEDPIGLDVYAHVVSFFNSR